MARRINEADQGTDRSEIEVFYAKAKGSGQSIQDLMRALTTAIRPVQVNLPPKLVRNSAPAAPATPQPEDQTLFNQELEQEEGEIGAEAANGAQETESGQNGAARRKRGEGTKQDRNAGIAPVPDLDFIPDGKPALKSFFAQKSPNNDMEQLLVIGYYLQHMVGLNTFGPGHILSGFKHVVKPVPVDLRQTIRNMKRKKVWLNYSDFAAIRLTTEGENVVEHELPGSGENGDSGGK